MHLNLFFLYTVSQLYSNNKPVECWTMPLSHMTFFLFKFVVSEAAATSMTFMSAS